MPCGCSMQRAIWVALNLRGLILFVLTQPPPEFKTCPSSAAVKEQVRWHCWVTLSH